MNKRVDVAILGTSVVMAGIAQALRTQGGPSARVVASADALPRLIEEHCPDIIIFDLDALTADDIRPLVRHHSGLTFIGIDMAGRQALTFSSRTCPLSSVDDLARLIDVAAIPFTPAP